jgi:hypothetical protein
MVQAVDFVKETSPAAGSKTDKTNVTNENTQEDATTSSPEEIRK